MWPPPLTRFKSVCRQRAGPAVAAPSRAPAAGAVMPAACTQHMQYKCNVFLDVLDRVWDW